MSAATDTRSAADVQATLDTRRARLAELDAGLRQIPDAISRQRDALGRALADGASEGERKRIRTRLAELEGEHTATEAAVRLVRTEVAALEAEHATLHAAELEDEADRLEEEAREAQHALVRAVERIAAEFVPLWEHASAAQSRYLAARRAALRAAGVSSEEIRYPKGKIPAPHVPSVAEQLAAHGGVAAVRQAIDQRARAIAMQQIAGL